MKYFSIILTTVCLTFIACQSSRTKNSETANDTANKIRNWSDFKPDWLDSGKVNLNIDTSLVHNNVFKCDSAILVDYNGSFGEHSYQPLNDKGQWISTLKSKKALSFEQIQMIQTICGSKKTFENASIIGCYEPRIGIIYFKDRKVICISAICLDCARVESTALLGSGDHYSSINVNAVNIINKFHESLNKNE